MSLVIASTAALSAFSAANPKAAFKDARFPGPGEPSEVRPGFYSGLPGDVGFDPVRDRRFTSGLPASAPLLC
jgi:hypothetical protein